MTQFKNYVMAMVGGDYEVTPTRVATGTRQKSSTHDLITPGETGVFHWQAESKKYAPGIVAFSDVSHKADRDAVGEDEKGQPIYNLIATRSLTSRENIFTLEELKPYFKQCWDSRELSYVGKIHSASNHYLDLTELFEMFPELVEKIKNRLFYGI